MKRMPEKSPSGILDYAFNWGKWLSGSAEISSVVIAADTGIDVDSETDDGRIVIVWLSGGTAGEDYRVKCTIGTTQGQQDARSMIIPVRDL